MTVPASMELESCANRPIMAEPDPAPQPKQPGWIGTLRGTLALTLLIAALGKSEPVLNGALPDARQTTAAVFEYVLGTWLLVARRSLRPLWGTLAFSIVAAIQAIHRIVRGDPVTSLCNCFGKRL